MADLAYREFMHTETGINVTGMLMRSRTNSVIVVPIKYRVKPEDVSKGKIYHAFLLRDIMPTRMVVRQIVSNRAFCS